jgi:hypothetical protein
MAFATTLLQKCNFANELWSWGWRMILGGCDAKCGAKCFRHLELSQLQETHVAMAEHQY